MVLVRHGSATPTSPLHPDDSGSAFKDVLTGTPDLLVRETVNSSFHGSADLHATHTFDRTGPDGAPVPAAELSRITGVDLHGEFTGVVTTAQLLAPSPWTGDAPPGPTRRGPGPASGVRRPAAGDREPRPARARRDAARQPCWSR